MVALGTVWLSVGGCSCWSASRSDSQGVVVDDSLPDVSQCVISYQWLPKEEHVATV